MNFLQKTRILNANAIKFLAAAFMLLDHIGLLLFPEIECLRALGRISMPLFAFAISEGCRYTRNKVKHFALLFCLAVICQIVYYFFDNGNLYMCILVTFSLSTLCIYALQFFKKKLLEGAKLNEQILSGTLLLFAVLFTYFFNVWFTVDYGFIGCMLPVFASLFDFRGINVPEPLKKLDCLPLRIACFGAGCLLMCAYLYAAWSLTVYMLFALPILLLYNGEKGKWKTKYFFYVFYPLHLVLLEGIYILTQTL